EIRRYSAGWKATNFPGAKPYTDYFAKMTVYSAPTKTNFGTSRKDGHFRFLTTTSAQLQGLYARLPTPSGAYLFLGCTTSTEQGGITRLRAILTGLGKR